MAKEKTATTSAPSETAPKPARKVRQPKPVSPEVQAAKERAKQLVYDAKFMAKILPMLDASSTHVLSSIISYIQKRMASEVIQG